jgi:hypothetical protein
MRCRVGDLAIVVRPVMEANLGILVEVREAWPHEPRHWWVESLSGPRPRHDGSIDVGGVIADDALWPIREGNLDGYALGVESGTVIVDATPA